MPLGVEPSQQISIHALREEGDNSSGRWATRAAIFLSTPSARRATVDGKTVVELDKLFLSTPSARRATACQDCPHHFCVISIHALREEGDHRRRTIPSGAANFYPRPPRGGRQEPPAGDQRSGDFYPRPPRGGRPLPFLGKKNKRENFYPRPPRGGRRPQRASPPQPCDFYPRPPRGGRPPTTAKLCSGKNFYPRPPRGGRPVGFVPRRPAIGISIHALREEGDLVYRR